MISDYYSFDHLNFSLFHTQHETKNPILRSALEIFAQAGQTKHEKGVGEEEKRSILSIRARNRFVSLYLSQLEYLL